MSKSVAPVILIRLHSRAQIKTARIRELPNHYNTATSTIRTVMTAPSARPGATALARTDHSGGHRSDDRVEFLLASFRVADVAGYSWPISTDEEAIFRDFDALLRD
jgi:hypothetical protein